MNLREVQREKNRESRRVVMTIRTSPEKSVWMKKNNVSPALLFNKAVEELMEKEGGKHER